MRTKIISLVLVILLLFSGIPTPVSALEYGQPEAVEHVENTDVQEENEDEGHSQELEEEAPTDEASEEYQPFQEPEEEPEDETSPNEIFEEEQPLQELEIAVGLAATRVVPVRPAYLRIESMDRTLLPRTEVFVDYFSLSEYGYCAEGEDPPTQTALHALIRGLESKGHKLPDATVLGASSGWVSSVLGVLPGTVNETWTYLVNSQDPGIGVSAYALRDYDDIVIYLADWSCGNASFFEKQELAVAPGEAFELNLFGYSFNDWWSEPYNLRNKIPIENAKILISSNGDSSAETSSPYSTDENGKVTMSFSESGVYLISAVRTNGSIDISRPYCKVTVSGTPIEPSVKKDALNETIKQADTLSYEDYTVESWIPFTLTLSVAKEAYDREDASQAEVDSARSDLSNAMEALIEIEEQDSSAGHTGISAILSDIAASYATVPNQNGSYLSDWQAFGMGAYSRSKDVQNIGSFAAHSLNAVLTKTRPLATDYEASAIAVSALGINARKVPNGQGGYYNLIDAIANWDGSSLGTINAYSNALLAYDMGGYELPDGANWTRESIIKYILSMQHSDGGWGLTNSSDPDVTAMVVSALADYTTDAAVKSAVDSAVTWLSNTQRADGGFVNTAESSAQVITALSALGIDAGNDTRFVKDGNSVLSHLLCFKTDDNRFKHVLNGFADTMATEQAFYALVAYDRMQRSGDSANIFRFGRIINEETDTVVKTITDQSVNEEISNSVKNPVLQMAAAGDTETQFTLPGVITVWNGVEMKIADGTVMTTPNGFDGKIMVAGKAEGLVVPGNINLQAAIRVGLASGTLSFSQPVRLFIPNPVGDEVGYIDSSGRIVPITTVLNEDSLAAAASALGGNINEAKIKTHEGMAIWTNHFTTFLTYTTSTGNAGNNATSNQSVYISVSDPNPSGMERTFLSKQPFGFWEGMTAYDLLESTGLWIETKGGGAVYVARIGTSQANSLGEFDEGPLSGWMYRVNGVLYESGAGMHTLYPGDYVEWLYTRDLGEDLRNEGAVNNRQAAGKITLANSRTTVPGKPKIALDKIYEVLDKILLEIDKRDEKSDWEEIVLILRGHAVSDIKLQEIGARVRENGGDFRLATDLAKTSLALQIAGVDITDFEGVNLLEKIQTYNNMGKQGINGYIFSLMVIYNAEQLIGDGEMSTAARFIETILAAQNEDGGFPLASGSASNLDITAMVMQALAPYVHREDVTAGVNKALAYFEDCQEEDGNFRQREAASSETLSQLIIALASLGINPDHQAYTKNGRSLPEILFAYRNNDGQFAHYEREGSDVISTEQAALALLAYANFFEEKPPVYLAGHKTDETEAEAETEIVEPTEDFSFQQNKESPLPYDFDKVSPWARPFIEKAYSLGLPLGNELDPGRTVTGAEFTDMLLCIGEVTSVDDTLKENFTPDMPLARQDIAFIIANVFGFKSGKFTAVDEEQAADYAKEAISAVMDNGIMSGVGGGLFDPFGAATWEMAVTVTVRLYEAMDK